MIIGSPDFVFGVIRYQTLYLWPYLKIFQRQLCIILLWSLNEFNKIQEKTIQNVKGVIIFLFVDLLGKIPKLFKKAIFQQIIIFFCLWSFLSKSQMPKLFDWTQNLCFFTKLEPQKKQSSLNPKFNSKACL